LINTPVLERAHPRSCASVSAGHIRLTSHRARGPTGLGCMPLPDIPCCIRPLPSSSRTLPVSRKPRPASPRPRSTPPWRRWRRAKGGRRSWSGGLRSTCGTCSTRPGASLSLSGPHYLYLYFLSRRVSPLAHAPLPRRRAATRRRHALAAALEERDVTLGMLLDDGGSGIGGMGLSVGQRMALERAVRRCEVGHGPRHPA
jgi:hypothetical protein